MSMRRYTVAIDGRSFVIDVLETASDRFEVVVDGRAFTASLLGDHDLPGREAIAPGILPPPSGEVTAVPTTGATPMPSAVPRRPATPAVVPPRVARDGPAAGSSITAPMPGVVLAIHVARGAVVRRGDPVLVLEAMKMRNTIRASIDARVAEVVVAAGQPVGPGDVLVRLESTST